MLNEIIHRQNAGTINIHREQNRYYYAYPHPINAAFVALIMLIEN